MQNITRKPSCIGFYGLVVIQPPSGIVVFIITKRNLNLLTVILKIPIPRIIEILSPLFDLGH